MLLYTHSRGALRLTGHGLLALWLVICGGFMLGVWGVIVMLGCVRPWLRQRQASYRRGGPDEVRLDVRAVRQVWWCQWVVVVITPQRNYWIFVDELHTYEFARLRRELRQLCVARRLALGGRGLRIQHRNDDGVEGA
ncbi:MAG: hypothetical protein AAF513_14745 [Pseudomonadota bacterium]